MKSVQILPRRTHAHGFSLLEMLLVLFLIGLMASAGLMLTEGVEDQTKYDETKRRMELMRRAIVGDPTRTVNGGPEISGFVADMGRLPGCVAELLQLGTEKTLATDPRTFESPCDNTVTLTEWHIDADTGIASGWRGPYIQVLPERNGARRFRDGYENDDNSENFGWNYSDADSVVRVQSAGMNGTFDGSVYIDDYPAGATISAVPELVNERDYLVDLQGWRGRILFRNTNTASALPNGSAVQLKLRLYYLDAAGNVQSTDSDHFDLALNAVPANDSGYSDEITFPDSAPTIPWGVRSVQVLCNDIDEHVFDGNCDADFEITFRTLALLPYIQPITFHFIWDINDV
jgi:prepilin-type N-terminal cleavage/methylation domain-containing protein